MIPFLKITTESARRMRSAVLSKQIDRIGRIWPYQTRKISWKKKEKEVYHWAC